MIRVESLTKRFNGALAVDALTLSVERGEVFGLLGPNGAGKTTTVRMLTTLVAPTSGAAWINGHEIGRDSQAVRASVGILTETPGLYVRLSAAQNLRLYAKLYGVADREGQIQKYLSLLGLWERRNDTAGTFSKGMRQKLAIARALLHEPAVLFLDEPTSGLDPESARVVRDFIEELRAQGRTIILCTHNLDEADRLCDRIGVFKQRLIQVDTPDALRRSLFGRTVVVRLRQVTPELIAAVRALPFAPEVTAEDARLRIKAPDPEGQNPAIIRALVAAGGEVQFVEEEEHSLEQVYFRLIDEAPGGAEGGGGSR